jgi:hypothetical protein
MLRKALLSAAAALLMTSAANADLVTFSGTGANGPESASALVTVNAGSITLVLTDLQSGQISSGQTLSGFDFTLSGPIGTLGTFTQSGTEVNVATGGAETPSGTSPTHWVGQLGGALVGGITINTVPGTGGQPQDLIVGPSPAANNGFSVFDPYIDQVGTFTLACSLCVAGESVTGGAFRFGTIPEFQGGRGPNFTTNVPEPSTWAMMILGFFGVGFMAYRRRSQGSSLRIA